MRDEDVKQYLIACLKNLDATGASMQQVNAVLLPLAVMEAAHSGHFSHRTIQDTVASILNSLPYEYRIDENGTRRQIPKR